VSALRIQVAHQGVPEDAHGAVPPDPDILSQLPQLQDLSPPEQQVSHLQLHRCQDKQGGAHQEAGGAQSTAPRQPGGPQAAPDGGDHPRPCAGHADLEPGGQTEGGFRVAHSQFAGAPAPHTHRPVKKQAADHVRFVFFAFTYFKSELRCCYIKDLKLLLVLCKVN